MFFRHSYITVIKLWRALAFRIFRFLFQGINLRPDFFVLNIGNLVLSFPFLNLERFPCPKFKV